MSNVYMGSATAPARINVRGFTLIELMVGLLLGMLTVIVVSQVIVMASEKRRTLAAGSDSQVNGALALYTLQREMQMAGYGLAINPAALGCAVKGEFADPSAPTGTPAAPFSPALVPVWIDEGANGMPDQITIFQSRKPSFSAPMLVSSDHAQTDEGFAVRSSLGAAAGDLMIAVPKDGNWSEDQWCTVFEVTSDGAGADSPTDATLTDKRIPHVSGGTSKWNRSSVFPEAGYGRGSYLLNMGSMSYSIFSVSAQHDLQLSTQTGSTSLSAPRPLYPQIVNLQAMYGKDTTGDGHVDTFETTQPTTAQQWSQVIAVRVAVVARSAHYEKNEVTLSAPLWDLGSSSTVNGAAACNGGSKCLSIKIDHVADWQHYRYKIFDTIVPLRNVLWNAGA